MLIGHNCRGVGVYQNDLQTLLFKCAASLRSRIVKFGSLSDNNRTRTDNQYFLYITS